ncbi:MAG: hypothetical protein WB760_26070 [Xanthobacteraceae bacterium]
MPEAISNFEAKFIRFPFVARRISCVKTYRRETHQDQHTFTRRGINFFDAKLWARSRFRNWHVKMAGACEVAERRNSIVGVRLSVSGHFRPTNDVGVMSVVPSIATKSLHCDK